MQRAQSVPSARPPGTSLLISPHHPFISRMGLGIAGCYACGAHPPCVSRPRVMRFPGVR